MRLLGVVLIACIMLSAARAMTIVLLLILAISITWALITRPLELLGFLFLGLLSGALQARPTITIMVLATVAILFLIRGNAKSEFSQKHLAGVDGNDSA